MLLYFKSTLLIMTNSAHMITDEECQLSKNNQNLQSSQKQEYRLSDEALFHANLHFVH